MPSFPPDTHYLSLALLQSNQESHFHTSKSRDKMERIRYLKVENLGKTECNNVKNNFNRSTIPKKYWCHFIQREK